MFVVSFTKIDGGVILRLRATYDLVMRVKQHWYGMTFAVTWEHDIIVLTEDGEVYQVKSFFDLSKQLPLFKVLQEMSCQNFYFPTWSSKYLHFEVIFGFKIWQIIAF